MFRLEQAEQEKLDDWLRAHKKTCGLRRPGRGAAIGGSLTYCFRPNSLVTVVTVKCACGAEVDLTDYVSWWAGDVAAADTDRGATRREERERPVRLRAL